MWQPKVGMSASLALTLSAQYCLIWMPWWATNFSQAILAWTVSFYDRVSWNCMYWRWEMCSTKMVVALYHMCIEANLTADHLINGYAFAKGCHNLDGLVMAPFICNDVWVSAPKRHPAHLVRWTLARGLGISPHSANSFSVLELQCLRQWHCHNNSASWSFATQCWSCLLLAGKRSKVSGPQCLINRYAFAKGCHNLDGLVMLSFAMLFGWVHQKASSTPCWVDLGKRLRYFPTFSQFLQCLEVAMSEAMALPQQFGLMILCHPMLILFVVSWEKTKSEWASV